MCKVIHCVTVIDVNVTNYGLYGKQLRVFVALCKVELSTIAEILLMDDNGFERSIVCFP